MVLINLHRNLHEKSSFLSEIMFIRINPYLCHLLTRYQSTIFPNHKSCVRKKGVPYMEGHHLIPCTVSNTERFWSKKRNIDCPENIICLCPICHRRIHFGRKVEKDHIIRSLYNKRKSLLQNVGIEISIDELLALY